MAATTPASPPPDAKFRHTAQPVPSIPSTAPAGIGVRLAPVALTTSTRHHADTRRTQAVRFPLHLTPAIHRWRVRIRNGNDVTAGVGGGPVSLTGLWVGPGWDGAYESPPRRVATSAVIPADGSEWVSPWINTPIGGRRRMMVSAGLRNQAQTNILSPGGCWRNAATADAAQSRSSTGFVPASWAPLNWWVEVEVNADVAVIAAWGDSNTAGTGTALPVNDSWLSQYARKVGAVPMHVAFPGTAMWQWADPSDRRWQRYQGHRADAVVHFMGQNDLASASSSLAEMKARFHATADLLKEYVSPMVYLATLTPSGRKSGQQNTVRREYEAWIRGLPGGARDVLEFAAAVSTDDTTLLAAYDAGDQLHMNTAGHTTMAAAITRPVARPDTTAGQSV